MKVLLYYIPVIILLTMLKGYLVIGHLWRKDSHHIREVQIVPFNDFFHANTIFGSAFNVLGNIMLFLPLGILVYQLVGSLRCTVLAGFLLSLSIEILQYIFSLGVTDTDDLLLNTLGAWIGAGLAIWGGTRMARFWKISCVGFATFIYVLYLLGPRLGSEEKMTPVAAGAETLTGSSAGTSAVTSATAL